MWPSSHPTAPRPRSSASDPERCPLPEDRGFHRAARGTRRRHGLPEVGVQGALVHDPTAAVATDSGVNWNLRGVKPLCPDAAVFFAKEIYGWSIFDVAAQGARPAWSSKSRPRLPERMTGAQARLLSSGQGAGLPHRQRPRAQRGTAHRIDRLSVHAQGVQADQARRCRAGSGWRRCGCGSGSPAMSGAASCGWPATTPRPARSWGLPALNEASRRAQAEALAAKEQARKAKRQLQVSGERRRGRGEAAKAEAEARVQAEARSASWRPS